MKTNRGLLRHIWPLLVGVSAVLTTVYLAGPRCVPQTPIIRLLVFLVAWGTVFGTFRAPRFSRRFWSIFLIASASIGIPLILLACYFEFCFTIFPSPPPPTPEQRRFHSLEHAVMNEDLQTVKTILSTDPDPDFVDCRDTSEWEEDCGTADRPLEIAVASGQIAIASALLDHGASATMGDPAPLVSAANRKPIFGNEPELPRTAGPTAKMTVTHRQTPKNVAMMMLLLQHGAVINDDHGSSSALCAAVENDDYDAVAFLLARGANPNSQRNDAEVGVGAVSVLHIAERAHDRALAKMLKEAIAKRQYVK